MLIGIYPFRANLFQKLTMFAFFGPVSPHF